MFLKIFTSKLTTFITVTNSVLGSPRGAVVKKPPAGDAGDMGLIPGSGKSPGLRNGNLLQYPCLKNYINRVVLQAVVHVVAKELDTTERLSIQLSPLIRSAPFFAFLFSLTFIHVHCRKCGKWKKV